MDNIGTIVLAAGALGTAAFGIVEAAKWMRFIGEAGFRRIPGLLGPIYPLYAIAYGDGYETLLRSQYRGDNRELMRTLRQGARIGLTPDNAEAAAKFLGNLDTARLKQAAAEIGKGAPLGDDLRNVVGRFELAVDARIDAAMVRALDDYKAAVRLWASIVAFVIAVLVGLHIDRVENGDGHLLLIAILVGAVAVPLAPMAKDLASALNNAAQAIRGKA
jgi:hypothetical protein